MARWPVYDQEQIENVVSVLKSGEVNAWTGPYVRQFEEAYADFLGLRHAIALANGTVALELALFALGLRQGDEVIVTPRSFMASAACVPFCGGVPIFADIDPDSQNLTAGTIAAQITPRTRGIIVVHLAGWPCDMQGIMALARENGLWVIEDCAQAHGAEIHGQPVGRFGDIAAFSFCQDKIITTGGEGGLIAMNDDTLWQKAWSRKDHGKSYDTVFHKAHPPGFRWLHESIGTNWRMTSIQAVLGLTQLKRLTEWQAKRARNAAILQAATADLEALRTPQPPSGFRHAYYRFYTFVRRGELKPGYDRDRIVAEVNAAGVPCFSGSCSEIYLEKAFTDMKHGPSRRLPVAQELGDTSVALLVDPAIDEQTMLETARVLRRIILSASRSSAREMDTASFPQGDRYVS
ncbi:aminotransferase [Rhizobium sp. Root73]|uniref:DegT/DnrJ/EryC1/StrS family aminotransferase n=1 Tax=unclassified Rhizobium TaxID=2613769 RepID=UPI0007248C91|nr:MULTISPECIES: DegT/DnrJ/EryC1/StrS aminotransferase family protein [unclassified Rhizobium]KQY14916.1 aminotransferase [Rhizobium sp. Root1334]KRC06355.1 aminotransferase [Rhizobium sp. Root73]